MMNTYDATISYETKKGNMKTAQLPVEAPNIDEATRRAALMVRSNGLRQVKSVLDTKVVLRGKPQARVENPQQVAKRGGFFSRLFGRGRNG